MTVNASTGPAAQARAGKVKWPRAVVFGRTGLAGVNLAKQIDGSQLLL